MVRQIVSAAIQADRARVGATLRALRRTRGWTLCEFAVALGISHPYLSNIEAGRKPLPDHLLARASRALQVEQIAIKHPDRMEVRHDSEDAREHARTCRHDRSGPWDRAERSRSDHNQRGGGSSDD